MRLLWLNGGRGAPECRRKLEFHVPIESLRELVALRRDLLSMGAAAEQRVNRVFRAIVDRDVELARSVRKGDHEIDTMELGIDAECLRLLALHHPVARDLRFVLAALRINTDLERIADLAKSIAKRVIYLAERPTIEIPEQIRDMTRATSQMLSDVLRALADDDVAIADHVRRSDEYVNIKNRELFQWAVEQVARSPGNAQAIFDVHTMARSIERIADLTTNIAEDVIFAVGGDVVKHAPFRAGADGSGAGSN